MLAIFKQLGIFVCIKLEERTFKVERDRGRQEYMIILTLTMWQYILV